MLKKAGHNLILITAALRNRLLLRDKEIAPKIVQGDEECFNSWGARGYGDSVPGEVTKTAPSGDRTT